MARQWLDTNQTLDAILFDTRQHFNQNPPPHFFDVGESGDVIGGGTGGPPGPGNNPSSSSSDSDSDSSDSSSSSGGSNHSNHSSQSHRSCPSPQPCTPHSSQGFFHSTPTSSQSPFPHRSNLSLNLHLSNTSIIQFKIIQMYNRTMDHKQGTNCWFIGV